MPDNKWADADRISDTIVDLMNAEIKKPGFSPLQLLAGQMLAMCAMASTCPRHLMPKEYHLVMASIEHCLKSMFEYERTEAPKH